MENIKNKTKTKSLCIALLLLIALLLIFTALKENPLIGEWVSVNVSKWWIFVFGKINYYLPFSVFEILIYFAIIALLFFISRWIYLLVKKRYKLCLKSFLVFAIILVSILNIYIVSASFAYYRPSCELIYATEEETDKDKFYEVAEYFIDDFNNLAESLKKDEKGLVVNPYSFSELSEIIAKEYDKLGSEFLYKFTPKAKKIFSSFAMGELSLMGIFFAPTGEANINADMPAFEFPVTIAHELAHAKGAMRERDANLFAYQICINSDNEFLRFSGYMDCISDLLSAVRYLSGTETYSELSGKISDTVKLQFSSSREYWANHSSLRNVQNFFNDLYLKLSGLNDGTDNYIIKDNVEFDKDSNEVISFEYNDVQKIFLYRYNNLKAD